MINLSKKRPGGWLPEDRIYIEKFIVSLRAKADTNPENYIEPIQKLADLVAASPALAEATEAMFVQSSQDHATDPLLAPSVTSWAEFLSMLNAIMTTAPQFYVNSKDQAMGLVGFPINALLDWPMATVPGNFVFSNETFNRQMQEVLTYWSGFLLSPASRYVLADSDPSGDPPTIAWLSDAAKAQMIAVACQPSHDDACLRQSFTDIFEVPDPNDPVYLGFSCWDEFFTRIFQPDQRPVGEATIVSACESAPLQYVSNVQKTDQFWLKGQPYSLENMFDSAELADQFAGGSVYQAFLSALSYHRWNSPVDGVIEGAYVIDGTYYLENAYEGFISEDPDPSAPNASQPFLTSVATRAVILIRANDPRIGLMAVVPVGMAEVSSCEITVDVGNTVAKGDQLGMFHFGGSTHCLVFGPQVTLEMLVDVGPSPNLDATNIAVKSNLAEPV
ncbi:phophatidylserine decarboxylase associated domain-containing protein [Hoeflea sp.]|uniref:phophatidylserine decarboxylase associated domain-containing protein n=1 Tax=Hoeflea sp. TaxID=1940281 RepID=UPI003748C028